jgi:hypothetical protein
MENWIAISDEYAVSDAGRLYSFERRGWRGGYMKLGNLDRDGYVKIGLRSNGQRKWMRFHRLVCEAFHGPAPEGCVVDHRNRDKLDNRAENLWWVSWAENNAKDQFGEAGSNAKLTEKEVREILRDPRSYGELGKVYGVHRLTIRDVKKNRTWRHVVREETSDCTQNP